MKEHRFWVAFALAVVGYITLCQWVNIRSSLGGAIFGFITMGAYAIGRWDD